MIRGSAILHARARRYRELWRNEYAKRGVYTTPLDLLSDFEVVAKFEAIRPAARKVSA